MFGKGGFQGARGAYGNSGVPPSTGREADSFFVENLFEELDADNEFFYDETTQTLYYVSSTGAPTGVVEATALQTFISIEGTQVKMPLILDDVATSSSNACYWDLARLIQFAAFRFSALDFVIRHCHTLMLIQCQVEGTVRSWLF